MVELKSCSSLVNASALCAIEQEVKGNNTNVITEISAELQKERQKNAELMKRISMLEAQINERNKDPMLSNGQVVCKISRGGYIRKFKRQRIEQNIKVDSERKHGCESLPKDMCIQDCLVNWMSMEDTPYYDAERVKERGSIADADSENEDRENFGDNGVYFDRKDGSESNNFECIVEEPFLNCGSLNEKDTLLKGISNGYSEAKHIQETAEDLKDKILQPDTSLVDNAGEVKKQHKENEEIGECEQQSGMLTSAQEVKEYGNNTLQKKSPKIAFCPKEVKRILESEALLEKNAQTHTIRKIIVFASLGIRHGCDDMYELDVNHFSILQKGEPFESPQNPGEHVLYENPGVRRRIFYPNRQNPTLCPVQVLEEERVMRPTDASCPSYLFLCIKYGGRTRNLPQNEYVRQRMGKNKLKSFGPVICQIGMLVYIRSGSFFFKALGITLLFMAGFPDDLVQRETKYRNLDLLQKYYRRDEDAEGEELFLSHPLANNIDASIRSNKKSGKMIPRESEKRKHISSTRKPHEKSSNAESVPASSKPPKQFELMGYGSTQVCAMASLHSTPSPPTANTMPAPNTMVTASGVNISFQNHSSCPAFPPQTTNAFVPVVYWPPPNAISAYRPYPCASSYSYKCAATGNYFPIYPHPYYSYPLCISPDHHLDRETANSHAVAGDPDTASKSSTSSTGPKER